MSAVSTHERKEQFETLAEPCESYLFSIYINEEGINAPCSFLEEVDGYPQINILEIDDFMKDVWYNDKVVEFRNHLINNIDKETNFRVCPHYNV